MTKARTFANVWDALEDSPEEAAAMTMRSNVMIAINDAVRGWHTTRARAARRLGITQPRLNDLLHGKINKVLARYAVDFGNACGAQGKDRRAASSVRCVPAPHGSRRVAPFFVGAGLKPALLVQCSSP
jgi:predicted XRE-type DNA-binding protein